MLRGLFCFVLGFFCREPICEPRHKEMFESLKIMVTVFMLMLINLIKISVPASQGTQLFSREKKKKCTPFAPHIAS